ncbi:phosphotransferase [Amycolatopsis sp. NPDC054798]
MDGAAKSARSATFDLVVPERGIYSEAARIKRLAWLRESTGRELGSLKQVRLDPSALTGNIENLVGAVEVPVGIAGPLVFHGQNVTGPVLAPMATTEGAVVASASRGARAVSLGGGVTTRVVGQRMIRSPMFLFDRVSNAHRFAEHLDNRWDDLARLVSQVSAHARLVSVSPLILGRAVHAQFGYETGEAAGQNMTTACTWHLCKWLLEEPGAEAVEGLESFSLEGNTAGDKSLAFRTAVEGRGTRVTADCVIPREIVEKVLKSTPEAMTETYYHATIGASHSGMIGSSVNVANVVAAIFTATGQDIACVHESSVGHLTMEVRREGLYASMTLAGLVVGTVGGGTHIAAQRELLDMLGCQGAGAARRLAEIVAGFALSLDLSTAAALVAGQFASAHERLGRSRPVDWFRLDELDARRFTSALRKARNDGSITVTAVDPVRLPLGTSILSELTARGARRTVGLYPLRLTVEPGDGSASSCTDVLVKIKPKDQEIAQMMRTLASVCGERLASLYTRFAEHLGFTGCDVREIAIYEQADSRFRELAPEVFLTYRDDTREAYVIALEYLHDMTVLDTSGTIRPWKRDDLMIASRDLGKLHSLWLGKRRELLGQPWIGHPPNARRMTEASDLWRGLVDHVSMEFPDSTMARNRGRLIEYIRTLPGWWAEIEDMPQTLIHNDFNPRNLGVRSRAGGTLCVFDWELATVNVPQHDLAELMCFGLAPDGVNELLVHELLEAHRVSLEENSGAILDADRWRRGYGLALRDLAINRFGLYFVAHTVRHYEFLERASTTLFALLGLEERLEADAAGKPDR